MPWPAGLVRPVGTNFANRVTYLNDNFDKIDAGFSSVYSSVAGVNSVPSPAQGVEWFDTNGTLQVYNGSSWQAPDVQETWGAWQSLTLQAPFTSTGAAPRIRVSNLKNVEMEGNINNTSGTLAWPTPSPDYVLVHTGQFQTTYLPEMTSVFNIGSSVTTNAGQFNAAQAYITVGGAPTTLQIYICFQGTRLTTNFVSLYNVKYKAA